MGKKLILVDGNSIANRAFYALPLLSNKQGIYTNAVYGFAQIILKVINEMKPDYLLVAFDAGKVTFRHTDFAEYKGKRQKTPSELSGQFPLIKELLQEFGVKYFELEGYEADDIIGTISKTADINKVNTIIYTGDKDMLQLASDGVSILLTRKGITEVEEYGPKQIKDKYNLTPQQIIDLKGLMGDASDNIPGVPGVGEKTALKLLHEFETVEKVLDNIDTVSGNKLKENLTTYKSQALLSKQLATIFRDVPMSLNLDEIKFEGYNPEQLYDLFKKLEFQSLIERLEITEKKELDTQAIESIEVNRFTQEVSSKWVERFSKKETIAIQLEYLKNEYNTEILGLALASQTETLFLTFDELKHWDEAVAWLADSDAPKWVYDGKGMEMALYWNGFKLDGIVSDLMLGVYLLNPSDGTVTLSEIANHYGLTYLQGDEAIYGKGAKWSIPDETILQRHISSKAKAVFELLPIVEENLVKLDLYELLIKLELPLTKVLAEMEQTGVLIDVARLHHMGEEINHKLTKLTDIIYELAGMSFNINSPKQLGEVLFDKLQLPVIKKTKTGYSTSADILEKLENQHPIISHIIDYRQLGKLYSTYIEGLLKMIDPKTNKIHTSFNQAITATGRLSSTEPNLQNIPIRLEEGRKIRQAFIPSEDQWIIIAADYSQIELRVLAHISKDGNLIEAFKEDLDVHTKTAMDVFGVEREEVTALMRRQAKAVNFGIVYGISDYGLSQNLNISRKEAGEFIDTYFKAFSGVKTYMTEVVKQAKKDGYVKTLLNRRRYLPEIKSPNFNIRSFAERTAMNTPIQGTAADIIKLAMVKISAVMKETKLRSRMLLQVHDELIFEVHPDETEVMKMLIKETMENALELDVPLKVDINLGQTWYEAK